MVRTILIFLFALMTMGSVSCVRTIPLRDRLDTYTEAEKHKLKPGYKRTQHQKRVAKRARKQYAAPHRSQGGKKSPKMGEYMRKKMEQHEKKKK